MKFSKERFILEPYKTDKSLKAENKNGFATIAQKNNLFGLKVLVATSYAGKDVPAGSTAFIREEMLHTHPWGTKTLKAEGIEGAFIIVEPSFIEFVETAE